MHKKRLKLVRDWKRCWKWLSMQFSVIGIAMSFAWGFLAPKLQDSIPNHIAAGIALVIFFLIAFGRVIDQNKDSEK